MRFVSLQDTEYTGKLRVPKGNAIFHIRHKTGATATYVDTWIAAFRKSPADQGRYWDGSTKKQE